MFKIKEGNLTKKKKKKITIIELVVWDKKISFQRCYYIFIWKTADTQGGANFDPQGLYGNLSRSPLDNATYQISKLNGLRFVRRRILKFFLSVAMVTRVLHEIQLFE